MEIRELTEELSFVKDQLEKQTKQLVNISGDIQVLDHKERRIMSLIVDQEYDQIRDEYSVDFEVIDGKIYFDRLSDYDYYYYFPTELAGLPMYFYMYNPNPEFTQVGYFLYDDDRKYDIHFHFENNNEFTYVATE
ncbi:hypothetical protein DS745_04065 [Anaerobacillus alkaliphilus]|uniref:Uncharacterized protein n=1 Tax=Anaerobacillus alkaliphilus TaxID=1548597 RepID=A0A4Q0W031_9BACI|nr:hypothetical protein [Anaerobacillus alkaliphilus]RXJ04568.1 hypothetical protein DS745_04065 [Anaerobacillus alkaliphilus]